MVSTSAFLLFDFLFLFIAAFIIWECVPRNLGRTHEWDEKAYAIDLHSSALTSLNPVNAPLTAAIAVGVSQEVSSETSQISKSVIRMVIKISTMRNRRKVRSESRQNKTQRDVNQKQREQTSQSEIKKDYQREAYYEVSHELALTQKQHKDFHTN
eukprot:606361-Amphidinium_carterae.1